MTRVAVTGSLSSGKTTVCEFFRQLGAFVISTDSITHHLLLHDQEIRQQVIALLGEDVLEKGDISRKKVAQKVFPNKKLLFSLEAILHPRIKQWINSEYQTVAEKSLFPLFVVEVPLLFECQWEKDYDVFITVHSDPQLRYQRFHKKTGKGEKEFSLRQENQWPPLKKCQRAHYILKNNGSEEQLFQQVQHIYAQIISNH